MNWQDDVKFPRHFKPLPPGYRIVQLDSDRYWVRRCAFAHFEARDEQ